MNSPPVVYDLNDIPIHEENMNLASTSAVYPVKSPEHLFLKYLAGILQ